MKHNILFLLLSLSFNLTFAFDQGDGSEANPFLINDIDDFIAFKQTVDKGYFTACAELNADIDLSDICYETEDTIVNWHSIAQDEGCYYKGTFNGKGHIIKNIFVKSDIECFEGVFGRTDSATIMNLGVENIHMQAGYYAGGIVGYADKTRIINCYSEGSISGYFVSGIAGFAFNSMIQNCFSNCILNGNYNAPIVGYSLNSLTENCYFNSSLSNKTNNNESTGYTSDMIKRGKLPEQLNNWIEKEKNDSLLMWIQNVPLDTIPHLVQETNSCKDTNNETIQIYTIGKQLWVKPERRQNIYLFDSNGKLLKQVVDGPEDVFIGNFQIGIYYINRKKVIIRNK